MTPSRGFAVQEPQPQSSRALLPLVGMTAVAWISGLVDLGHEGAWLYVLSVLLLASVVTPMLALSGRQPAWLLRISPMVFLASAAMLVLSQADEHSGLTVVVLLSVLTVAIRGSRTDSLITTAAMLATLLAIMEIHHTRLLVELRVLILWGAMGLVISAAIQGLRERLQLIQLQLESHANTDPLTGLANRRGLDTEVARLRGRRPFALLSIDVDGLKKVNDTQGHAAGDELLTSIAVACRHTVRQGDFVARVGGDELVVFIADSSQGQQVAARIERAINDVVVGGTRASASIGCAVGSPETSLDEVLELADQRMYEAKRARLQPQPQSLPTRASESALLLP